MKMSSPFLEVEGHLAVGVLHEAHHADGRRQVDRLGRAGVDGLFRS